MRTSGTGEKFDNGNKVLSQKLQKVYVGNFFCSNPLGNDLIGKSKSSSNIKLKGVPKTSRGGSDQFAINFSALG